MKHLFILGCCLCSVLLYAQSCEFTLRGQVIDFHNQEPLANAQVYLPVIDRSTITDLTGQFMIEGLCELEAYVEIYHISCEPFQKEVQFETDKPKVFYMEHHLEELNEVAIVEQRIARETLSAQETTLTQENLSVLSNASFGDALATLNGVSALSTGSGIVKPVIQGLSGSRIITMSDGVRMQDMEWGDEHAPSLDLNSAASIKVIKGGAALKYGSDAVGGIIIVEGANPIVKDTLYGKASLSAASNGLGGTLNTSLTKATLRGWFAQAQASYKRLGDQESADYVLSNTGIEQLGVSLAGGFKGFERGFNVKYSYFDTRLGILRAAHIGNVDDLIEAINSGEPNFIGDFTYTIDNPYQDVQHHLAKVEAYKRFQGFGKVNLQYDIQVNNRQEFDLRRGDKASIPAMDISLTTQTLSTNFTLDRFDNIKAEAGVMGRYQVNTPDPDTGIRRLIPDYTSYEVGAFASARWSVSDKMTLDAGARYDLHHIDAEKFYFDSRWEERGYDQDFADIVLGDEEFGNQLLANPVFTFQNIAFTSGFAYDLSNNYELTANYSFTQRPPNPAELFSDGLHHSAARIELGDLRIGQEQSNKISGTFLKKNGSFMFGVSPYVQWIEDFIQLAFIDVQQTIRGAFPVWEYQVVDAIWTGVDVEAAMTWDDQFTTSHQFAFIKGLDRTNGTALFDVPQVNLTNRLNYSLNLWHGVDVNLTSQVYFRQNETPPNIRVFSQLQEEEVLLEINTAPKGYHLLGLSAAASLSKNTRLRLGATNIFNTNYRNYTNRLRYFADDLGRNFNLQFLYKF